MAMNARAIHSVEVLIWGDRYWSWCHSHGAKMNRASRVETTVPPSRRYWYLVILALCGFVTSFGAHIVATNLPAYAQVVGVGALMIGLLVAVYDFAELFAKPAAGFIADRRGMRRCC